MKFLLPINDPSSRDPKRVDWAVKKLAPWIRRYHRGEVRGLERIPLGRPALFVGNHNAGVMIPDSYILCEAIYNRFGIDELPYPLGHQVAFSVPGVNHFFIPLGALKASHDNGHKVFTMGAKALVYPGGDIDTYRSYRRRNEICFGERAGFVKMAIREQVPIIPVVAAGAQRTFYVIGTFSRLATILGADKLFRIKVWPLALSIPWGLTWFPTPPFLPLPRKIIVEILNPIEPELPPEAAEEPAAVAKLRSRVIDTMQRELTRLAIELKDI